MKLESFLSPFLFLFSFPFSSLSPPPLPPFPPPFSVVDRTLFPLRMNRRTSYLIHDMKNKNYTYRYRSSLDEKVVALIRS
jgi:hypothetical protein